MKPYKSKFYENEDLEQQIAEIHAKLATEELVKCENSINAFEDALLNREYIDEANRNSVVDRIRDMSTKLRTLADTIAAGK